MRVNEIRKAIYHSELTKTIDKYVKDNQNKEYYKKVFSDNDRKRYEDYGRFYKSIAFYIRSNKSQKRVDKYNSRPREMINDILQEFQNNSYQDITTEIINDILEKTIKLLNLFKENKNKDYLVDACIPFAISGWNKLEEKKNVILNDEEILSTFLRSPATTSNVNKRFSTKIKWYYC